MPPPDAAEAAAMARLIGGVSLLEPLPVAPNVFTLNTVGAPAARGLTPAGPGAAWWPLLTQAGAKSFEAGSATLSPDGKTLFASAVHGYVAIDTGSLKLRGAYLNDRRVGSLVATPDGRWLLAVQDYSRLIRIAAADGRVDATLLSAGGPIEALRVYSVS